jgi:pre-mRNA-splicing helicase BRR2
MDWITWTFMYRRLLQNPNYYDMKGKSNAFLNDYLSELLENTLTDLKQANCISVDDQTGEIRPLNFGRISVFYYVKYNTIDLFSQSLKESTGKLKDLIEILVSAYEFEDIPIRKGDEPILEELERVLPYKMPENQPVNEAHGKSYILLRGYFSRHHFASDLIQDTKQVVEIAQRLIIAMVDVLSTKGLLKHAILAMELSQMIIQGQWINDSPLLQLPYFDAELVEKCKNNNVEDISDLMNMEDEDRKKLLKFNDRQFSEIAKVCNRYPIIDLKVNCKKELQIGDELEINVVLERDYNEAVLTPVHSLYYHNVRYLK